MMLYHTFQNGREPITCRPDAASLLRIPKQDSNETVPLLGYWEVDRSTESLNQVKSKLPGYAMFLKMQAYRRHWPELTQPAVRIFFVCQSQERMANVIDAITGLPAANAFRFCIQGDLEPKDLLNEPIWLATDGQRRAIIRASQ
ncbi:hypothetical protein CL635_00210 [bacterium]|nr:hypothetical protein [bacterium]|tara:strand:+ start:27963 stop:28394 length:432 start_codon:yes stop_codon:yes gene_type:complete